MHALKHMNDEDFKSIGVPMVISLRNLGIISQLCIIIIKVTPFAFAIKFSIGNYLQNYGPEMLIFADHTQPRFSLISKIHTENVI